MTNIRYGSGPKFGLSHVERPKVQQLLEKHSVQEALLIFMKELVDRTGERNSTERLAKVFEDDHQANQDTAVASEV